MPDHPRRPLGFARMVAAEHEDIFTWFPDASDAMVARLLGIDEYELRDCLRRERRRAAQAQATGRRRRTLPLTAAERAEMVAAQAERNRERKRRLRGMAA